MGNSQFIKETAFWFKKKNLKAQMSFIIIKIWFVILVILLETTWKNPFEVLVKALQGLKTAIHILPLVFLCPSETTQLLDPLFVESVSYTLPHPLKNSHMQMLLLRREREEAGTAMQRDMVQNGIVISGCFRAQWFEWASRAL